MNDLENVSIGVSSLRLLRLLDNSRQVYITMKWRVHLTPHDKYHREQKQYSVSSDILNIRDESGQCLGDLNFVGQWLGK